MCVYTNVDEIQCPPKEPRADFILVKVGDTTFVKGEGSIKSYFIYCLNEQSETVGDVISFLYHILLDLI